MAASWDIRPFDPELHRSIVEDLWAAALAPTWPPLPRAIAGLRSGFVAARPQGAAGFVGIDHTSVPLLVVGPAWQRQGCGTALLEAVLAALRERGVRRVTAGSGGSSYVWPGAPLDLPAGIAFFARHGWHSPHDTMDLTRDLRGYRPPAGIYDRSLRSGVALTVATAAELADVAEFEAGAFPQWAGYFDGNSGDILVARDRDGRIVGTLLYSIRETGYYAPMLGPDPGSIGCVGVAPDCHNRGIGSAMVAHASEILRDAGTRVCHIGWAVRDTFYARVGYRPWRHYRMFGTDLAAPPT